MAVPKAAAVMGTAGEDAAATAGAGASAPPTEIQSKASRIKAVKRPWIRAPSRTPT